MNHGSTILIAEDDDELAQLLKLRIEAAGYRVLTTTDGDDVIHLTETKLPDLIILDIFLPDTDGLTILKRLKSPLDIETGKPSKIKDIPVIAITGKAPMIENMARMEGAADFFVKPVDAERLLNRTYQLLEMTHERGPKP